MGLLGNPNFDDPEENAKFDEIMEAWRHRQFFLLSLRTILI